MPLPLQTLAKYRILEELGRGGFATVYRAEDTTLGREVALKILHPQLLTDSGWVERFHREARAIARLRHPHIVTIYEIGKADERLYIAMDLITAGSVHERLATRGRFTWDETLVLLRQVADALDYAHGEGIVHRDLKPANILLDPRAGAVLTDFGFAKLVSESSMSLSLSGGVMGTPAYIAPEIWDGHEPTPQSDIYALGCVIFELLMGERLFDGKTPSVVMRKHLIDGPQFPATWPEETPPGVEDVLRKALAREPKERYSNTGAFLVELARLTSMPKKSAEAVKIHDEFRDSDASLSAISLTSSKAEAATPHLEVHSDSPSHPPVALRKRTLSMWTWGLLALAGIMSIGVVIGLSALTRLLTTATSVPRSVSTMTTTSFPTTIASEIPTSTALPTTTPTSTPTVAIATQTATPMPTPTSTPMPIISVENAARLRLERQVVFDRDKCNGMWSMALSPDNDTIALAPGFPQGSPGFINLWSLSQDRLLYALPHNQWISTHALSFFTNAPNLVSGVMPFGSEDSKEDVVRIWNTNTGLLERGLATAEGLARNAENVIVSTSGEYIGIGAIAKPNFYLIRTTDWVVVQTFDGAGTALAFTPDSQQLVTAANDGVRFWRIEDGTLVDRLDGFGFWPMEIDVSSDGKLLAAGTWYRDRSSEVQVWDITRGIRISRVYPKRMVRDLQLSPDGSLLTVAGSEGVEGRGDVGAIEIWNTTTGEQLVTFEFEGNLSFSRFWQNGSALVAGSGCIAYIYRVTE